MLSLSTQMRGTQCEDIVNDDAGREGSDFLYTSSNVQSSAQTEPLALEGLVQLRPHEGQTLPLNSSGSDNLHSPGTYSKAARSSKII